MKCREKKGNWKKCTLNIFLYTNKCFIGTDANKKTMKGCQFGKHQLIVADLCLIQIFFYAADSKTAEIENVFRKNALNKTLKS